MKNKSRNQIKARPLCGRLRGVARAAAARAEQEGQDPELAKHAEVIRTLCKRVTKDIIEIGRRLYVVKDLVLHDKWGDWLEKEFAWSEGTALNFMRVFKFAEERKNKNFTDLDIADLEIAPSALYALARKSTPDEVVDEMMARAEAGEAITNSTMQEALAKHAETNKAEQPAQEGSEEGEAEQPEQEEGEAEQPEQEESEAEKPAQALDADPLAQAYRNWLSAAVKHANALARDAEIVDDKSLDEGRRQALLRAIEPKVLDDLREGAIAGLKLFNFLRCLIDEANNEDVGEDDDQQ